MFLEQLTENYDLGQTIKEFRLKYLLCLIHDFVPDFFEILVSITTENRGMYYAENFGTNIDVIIKMVLRKSTCDQDCQLIVSPEWQDLGNIRVSLFDLIRE